MATFRLCSIPGCGKRHKAHGWCNPHYMRWLAHGDPLGGRTPPGDPDRYLREFLFSYEGNECQFWPYGKGSNGYGLIKQNGRNALVHRIVCEQANGAPPDDFHEAAHSCGNGHLGCATKRHLSWKTHLENDADKIAHDTLPRGERSGRTILTEDDVRAIRLLKGTQPQRAIADKYGVSVTSVSQIQNRHRWGWL